MTKTIPTTLGILIIVLVAGVAGASILLFNQDIEEDVVLEEETFIEEGEIITEDYSDPEESETIKESKLGKDIKILSVSFIPKLVDGGYSPNTEMIVEVEGDYKTICLAKSGGPGIEAACGRHGGLPIKTEEKNNKKFVKFKLTYLADTEESFIPLCHRLSDFHYIYFFDKEIELIKSDSVPIKQYSCSEIEKLTDKEGEFLGWNVYKNERYNYEIRYPENYRIADSIMEEILKNAISLKEYEMEEYNINKTEKGKDPSLEDSIVITNMTIKEEQDYLNGNHSSCGAMGPIGSPGTFPGGTILIAPDHSLSSTIEMEENINKGDGVWIEDGWEWSNFRIEETNSGIKIKRWEFVGHTALGNASIALPQRIISPYPAYSGSSELIEKMKYFDQIRFWTPICGGYDEELFSKIVSTFKFLD